MSNDFIEHVHHVINEIKYEIETKAPYQQSV